MNNMQQELDRIARHIDTHGIAASETAIALVLDRAQSAGVDPVLLSVLSDTSQPAVARGRAFGMVATALAAAGDGHPHRRDVAGEPAPERSGNGVTQPLLPAVATGTDLERLVQ